jgi:hypothetical protein
MARGTGRCRSAAACPAGLRTAVTLPRVMGPERGSGSCVSLARRRTVVFRTLQLLYVPGAKWAQPGSRRVARGPSGCGLRLVGHGRARHRTDSLVSGWLVRRDTLINYVAAPRLITVLNRVSSLLLIHIYWVSFLLRPSCVGVL